MGCRYYTGIAELELRLRVGSLRENSSAYRDLLSGIEKLPVVEDLVLNMIALGFLRASFVQLTLGIAAILRGRKPKTD